MKTDSTLTEKLRRLRDALTTGLVERDLAIRLALIAAIAGEHLLLLGPPGTAKSLVSRRLHLAFNESAYFERLLTRFTVPEELFGPLSIKGLEADRYERLTEKYLPTASIAFLDEIFKANSAILNALLTLLNEREFDNGTRREKTPLISVIGASNELPEGEELAALADRFLLRLHVGRVSSDGFKGLLELRGQAAPVITADLKITQAELEMLQHQAESVVMPQEMITLLCSLREKCDAEKIYVSDRRWRKIVKLLQVSALTNGRTEVTRWDAWLLQHCLWENPEDLKQVSSWYEGSMGVSGTTLPEELIELVEAKEAELKTCKSTQCQAMNEHGNLLFIGDNGDAVTNSTAEVVKKRNGETLYLAPGDSADNYGRRIVDRTNGGTGYTVNEVRQLRRPDNHYEAWSTRNNLAAYLADPTNTLKETCLQRPKMEPARFKDTVVRHYLSEVDTLCEHVDSSLTDATNQLQSLESEVRSHLWVTDDFIQPATEKTRASVESLRILLTRAKNLHQGFDALPREISVSKKAERKLVELQARP